jgi:membrane-bound lytic murein transglycosylase D
VSIPALAEALDMDLDVLCSLNPSYKKKIVNGTETSPKRLVIPRISLEDFTRIYEILNEDSGTGSMRVILASNSDKKAVKKTRTKSRPAFFYHKVSPGQNLGAIANKYHVEVQDLKVWNKLRGSTIVPGQKLKVYDTTGEDNVRRAEKG